MIRSESELVQDKSRCLIHSKDKLIEIKLGGKIIKRCGYGLQEESVCLLGLQIDENLDWKVHIKKVEKKISKGNYLLWRHSNKTSISLKKIIYESFVRCHILYCLPVWGGAKICNLKPLTKLLSKTWSKIGKRHSHTLNRLKKYKILKLEDELKIQESKIIWRWEKKVIPISLSNIIIEKHDNLRGRRFENLITNKKNSIKSCLVLRANKEILDIAKHKTKKALTTAIKKRIFDTKYVFQCIDRNCYICTH